MQVRVSLASHNGFLQEIPADMDELTVLEARGKGYTARLFGDFSLIDPNGDDCTPRSRKTRGLAAYLLLSKGRPVPRDRAADLLWGDRGEEQARASLRQALYELRPLATGENPLFSVERSDIRLAVAQIETDLDGMRKFAAGGDAAALCLLLGEQPGEFLAGATDLAEGFDEWLAGERVRRTEERRALVLGAAERALQADDADHAIRLATALLAIEPHDEAATRLAMLARCRIGDRDGVRRVYARYAGALRDELDIAPPPEMKALLDELVSTPVTARSIASPRPAARVPPGEVMGGSVAEADLSVVSAVRPRPGTLVRRRRLLIAALAGATLAVGAGLWLNRNEPDGQRIILVEPFATPNGDMQARALGNVASDLSRMIVGNDHGLSIVDPTDSAAPGRHADFVVSGDAQTSGGDIHASIRLLDRANGSILWSRSFSRPVAEVDGLRDQIASHLGDVAVCAIGGKNPSLADLGVETMRLYLQACEDKHGDWANSAKLLAQVVQRQPTLAHAWAMLAAATGVVALSLPEEAAKPQFQLAATYAHRALALDPHDGEAYLGLIYAKSDFAHLPERLDLLAKGHAADPNNGVLALFLAEELATVGRMQEGAPFAQRAIELDPFNQWAAATLLRYRAYGGDLDGAKSVFATASQRWPHDSFVATTAFGVAARVGDPAAAAAMLDDPHNDLDMPPDWVAIWRAFLRARQTRSAADIDQFVRLTDAQLGPQDPDQRVAAATNYVILGRTDLAFTALDRIGKAAPENTYLLFLDVMGPLRADPRFIAVAARLGLVSIWRRTNHWPDFCSAPGFPYNCQGVAAKLAI